MNSRLGLILAVLAIAVLAGSLFVLRKPKAPAKVTPTQTTAAPTSALPKENTVKLGTNGFSPKSITIKVGEAVRFTNSEFEKATVSSDDHPTHRKYPEINLGEFAKGQTLVHIFSKKGTFAYHDHYNPQNKGTIVVQ